MFYGQGRKHALVAYTQQLTQFLLTLSDSTLIIDSEIKTKMFVSANFLLRKLSQINRFWMSDKQRRALLKEALSLTNDFCAIFHALPQETKDQILEEFSAESVVGIWNPAQNWPQIYDPRFKSLINNHPMFKENIYNLFKPSDLNAKKAYVHEYGMTIHARTKPYLHFQIGDKWIKTKQVRIRQKRFFRSGWDEARAKFPQFITTSIGRGLYK
jgi:hypothetical protein